MRSREIAMTTLPGNIAPPEPTLVQAGKSRRLCTSLDALWIMATLDLYTRARKVNKLVREPKASRKGDQHFTDILAGQSGRCFVGLAVKFERVRWSGR
jgi:hypothetical protein